MKAEIKSKMHTYEFITPSDPITFKADDDKVAFACAVLLGDGKAGCHRMENGEQINIPSMLMFNPNAEKVMDDYVGGNFESWLKENKPKMCEAFNSFSYGGMEDRKQFDDAIEAITDPVKLKEFKAKHEDRNRSSMSQWVKYAWQLGEKMSKK